mmetsp:Transcript_28299/g.38967  ORF Transcript_28299/g.38967 Transcript_28299/m.38967 type:complete len:287 (+) Transcript_28299:662-1522(+)
MGCSSTRSSNLFALLCSLLVFGRITISEDYVKPRPFTNNNRILSIVLSFNLDHAESIGFILRQYVSICEAGWNPTVAFLTVVPRWEANVTSYFDAKYFCYRTNESLKIEYSIHDPQLGHYLTVQHRPFIAKNMDKYDVFVYQEDDMIITPSHIAAYVDESHYLHETSVKINLPVDSTKMVGFIRYRKKMNRVAHGPFDSLSFLQEDGLVEAASYHHVCIGDRPYVEVQRNTHQAVWVLTKWQLVLLQNKCNFLQEAGRSFYSLHLCLNSHSFEYLHTQWSEADYHP